MIILGIDPGTARVGFGVINQRSGRKLNLVEYGTLEINDKSPIGRLSEIEEEISKMLNRYRPDLASVERVFFSKNRKTALTVSEARGVILSTLAKSGVPIKEYTPMEVKKSVTGYGQADKKSVMKMVNLILNIKESTGYDDASDALAIAITAANNAVWE